MRATCRGCETELPPRKRMGRPQVWCTRRCKEIARRDALREDPAGREKINHVARDRRIRKVHDCVCVVCDTRFQVQGRAAATRCSEHRRLKHWVECPCGVSLWKPNEDTYCSYTCFRTIGPRVTFDESDRKGRRRIRENTAPGLNQHLRTKLLKRWKRQGRTCWACDSPADTVDHAVPLSRGGTNWEGNLLPACRSHNSSRGQRLIVEWRCRRGWNRTRAQRDTQPEPAAA